MYRVFHTLDLPDVIEPETIYLIPSADHGKPFSATVACPGDCGEPITLNLMKPYRPRWELDETTITLSPSIDMKLKPCKCHFFIKNGALKWANEQ